MLSSSCLVVLLLLVGQVQGHARRENDIEKSNCDRYVDVAIVGAGAGGAYSAYKLRMSGLSVELFEYSNRIGGRLFTSTLPNAPDLNLELGGMRFIKGVHDRMERLVDELGLTAIRFKEGFGKPGRTRYFVRGKSLTLEEMLTGDVPYDLSPEEKANQSSLWSFYLKKLTGFTNSEVTAEDLLHMKVADGRHLYKLTIDEALDMVATPEGKEFAIDFQNFESLVTGDCNAIQGFESQHGEVYTVKEGMSSVPSRLVETFVQANESHKVTLNRQLTCLRNERKGNGYVLVFEPTQTVDGITKNIQEAQDIVCARSVILAIPNYALKKLNWKPLRQTKVKEALNAVRPSKASKVFMTFSEHWWINEAKHPAYVYKSDTEFMQVYDWKQSEVTGDYAMIASYADGEKTKYLQKLNTQGSLVEGSATGANSVTEALKDDLLDDLANAFGISRENISEPVTAISQFWTSYPFGGGWVEWLAGYHYWDVRSIAQRPSISDDVFVVGSDIAPGELTVWAEGAFESVDYVVDKYFL